MFYFKYYKLVSNGPMVYIISVANHLYGTMALLCFKIILAAYGFLGSIIL